MKKKAIKGFCLHCKKPLIKTQWNQRYHPRPMPCKDRIEKIQHRKHVASLLRDIRLVMAGKRSIHSLRTDSGADKRLIKATFKKAGYIY